MTEIEEKVYLKSINNVLESVWSLQAGQGRRREVIGNLHLEPFPGICPLLLSIITMPTYCLLHWFFTGRFRKLLYHVYNSAL